MTYKVEIAPSAQADINEAYLWWAENRSKEQADRWYGELLLSIETLRSMPLRCPLCDESDLRPGVIRQLLFGLGNRITHRIVFTVSDQTVSIVRVRHVAQDALS